MNNNYILILLIICFLGGLYSDFVLCKTKIEFESKLLDLELKIEKQRGKLLDLERENLELQKVLYEEFNKRTDKKD